MTTPHPHVDPDASLERIRAVRRAWEAGAGTTALESWEDVGEEFSALDRHLCNGGALPGDWEHGPHRRSLENFAERGDTIKQPGDEIHITRLPVVSPSHVTVDHKRPCCPHVYRVVFEEEAESAYTAREGGKAG